MLRIINRPINFRPILLFALSFVFGITLFRYSPTLKVWTVLVPLVLAVYIGGAFLFNAVTVAIGEVGVLLTLGSALYYALRARSLDKRLFG